MSFRPTRPILSPEYTKHVRVRQLTYSDIAQILTVCRQSPSIYAIIPSIRASDGCNTVGRTFAGLTTSFPPGALSSIGPDSSTYSFDFGDLPCPPADKGWDSSRGRYTPQIAPPDFLFKLDPAFATCTPGYKQGIDPYTTLKSAQSASGPGAVGCRHGACLRNKRAVERPHLQPWGPQKTAEPAS